MYYSDEDRDDYGYVSEADEYETDNTRTMIIIRTVDSKFNGARGAHRWKFSHFAHFLDRIIPGLGLGRSLHQRIRNKDAPIASFMDTALIMRDTPPHKCPPDAFDCLQDALCCLADVMEDIAEM